MCSRRDLRGFGGPSLEEDVDFLRCEEEEKAGMREEGIRAGDERGEWREVKMNKAQIFGFSACTRRVTPRCWTRRASRASPPAASPCPALPCARSRVLSPAARLPSLAGWASRYVGGITSASSALPSSRSLFCGLSFSQTQSIEFHVPCGYR